MPGYLPGLALAAMATGAVGAGVLAHPAGPAAMTGKLGHDLAWLQSHAPVLLLAAAACLVPLVIAAIVHAGRKGSLARALRSVAIPLVLLWEAQGLFLVALRVRVPHDLAYVLAGVTCAVVLTFAAYAHEHHKKHGTLGPNGRMMWYVAVPMGLIVAANSRSLAETGLRIVLPLLSVMAFRAAYLPDEPAGHSASQGSWRLTPRRLGVALGLIDPADTDLIAVHAERSIRLLTRHAAGYHRGARALRRWHGWRFERLALMADDAMIGEAAARVRRAHDGLASTAPEPAATGTAGTAPVPVAAPSPAPAAIPAETPSAIGVAAVHSAPIAAPVADPAGAHDATGTAPPKATGTAKAAPGAVRRVQRKGARDSTDDEMKAAIREMRDADPERDWPTKYRVMKDLGPGKDRAQRLLDEVKAERPLHLASSR